MTEENNAASAATAKPCPPRYVKLPAEMVTDTLNTLKGVLSFVDYVECTYIDSYTLFAQPLDLGDPRDADDWHSVAAAASARRGLMNLIDDLQLEEGMSGLPSVLHSQIVNLDADNGVTIGAASMANLGRAVALLNHGLRVAKEQSDAVNRSFTAAECDQQIRLWQAKRAELQVDALEDASPEGEAFARLARRAARRPL